MAALIKRSFAAGTLVESLTAITILSIAGAATFMTIGWIISSNQMPRTIQVEAALRAAAKQTLQEKRLLDEAFELNGWKISRHVTTLPDFPNCFLLHFTALDEVGNKISEYDEIACDI